MQRRADALREQSESILAKAQDSASEGGFQRSNARRIQDATRPIEPANVGASLVLAAFVLGALTVGLVFVFLREQLDDTIRQSSDLADHLDVPFLGPLPRIRDQDLKALPVQPAEPLTRTDLRELKRLTAAEAAPHSVLAETLRRALFQLRRQTNDPRARLVAITALLSGEGKSFFAFTPRQRRRSVAARRAAGAEPGLRAGAAPGCQFAGGRRVGRDGRSGSRRGAGQLRDSGYPTGAYVADTLQVSPLARASCRGSATPAAGLEFPPPAR